MNVSTPRWPVFVCGYILGLTFVGKTLALIHGSGLLAQPHPFLPGNFEVYIWLGLFIELFAFAILAFAGARAFLTACLGLAILFIIYHALEVYLQIAAPCPCLGGLLSHWKPLTGAESTLSFLLACGLGISSFIGLFMQSPKIQSARPPQPAGLMIGLALILWLLASALILWFWQGRIIGGDEGMEAAKSLQLFTHPENVSRMWNDQPPLLTYMGIWFFTWFGPSLTVGRVLAILLETLLPLTLAIYWSRVGMKWVAIVAIPLLWLILPFKYSAFMLEAPAYCVGMAALLPLLWRGPGRWALCCSAVIAALALTLKLTAAFALVVPFVWLWQHNWRRAIIWGTVTVALLVAGSFLQPGWSWSSMSASHLDLGAKEALTFRFDPLVYAQGWLVCALAVFAIANRYVRNELALVVPWLAAALAALCIHLIHRPYWDYYAIHLMTPLVVLAGIGFVDFWRLWKQPDVSRWQRRLAGTFVIGLCGIWTWQQGTHVLADRDQATLLAASPVVKELKILGDSGHTEFSVDPFMTFAAGQPQTPPELTIIPRKRVWAGQVNDTIIAQMLATNHVDAIVLYQNAMKEMVWSNLLSHYLPAARDDTKILFVRRELKPKRINLDEQSEVLHQLGL